MLSIEKCTQILNANGKKYTEQEVKAIRQLLYDLAQIEYQLSKQNRYAKK